MGALSDITAGVKSDGSFNVSIGVECENLKDMAATLEARFETTTKDMTNEEKLTIHDGLKFADTKITLTANEQSMVDTIRGKIEDQVKSEIRAEMMEKIGEMCFRAFLNGGMSFSSMINNAISLGNVGNDMQDRIDDRIGDMVRAIKEDTILKNFEGHEDNLAQTRGTIVEKINTIEHTLDRFEKYHEANGGNIIDFFDKGNGQGVDNIKLEALENALGFKLDNYESSDKMSAEDKFTNDIMQAKETVLPVLNEELREYNAAIRYEDAISTYGGQDNSEKYMDLKQEVHALQEIKKESPEIFSDAMKDQLKQDRYEMRSIEIAARHDDLEQFKYSGELGENAFERIDVQHKSQESNGLFDNNSSRNFFNQNNFGNEAAG